MITRDAPDALDIDTLANRVDCSRATSYRYAGGKAQIRDAVIARAASRAQTDPCRSVRSADDQLSPHRRGCRPHRIAVVGVSVSLRPRSLTGAGDRYSSPKAA
jgi:AcrR family transcriptional regulator